MTLWSENDPPEPANHDFKNEAPAKWPSGPHSLTGKKWPPRPLKKSITSYSLLNNVQDFQPA